MDPVHLKGNLKAIMKDLKLSGTVLRHKIRRHGRQCFISFMASKAEPHRGAEVTCFLAEEEIQVMMWPAQSSKLNLIENLCHILKVKFHEHFTKLRYSLSQSSSTPFQTLSKRTEANIV
jgi:hypothetical protein